MRILTTKIRAMFSIFGLLEDRFLRKYLTSNVSNKSIPVTQSSLVASAYQQHEHDALYMYMSACLHSAISKHILIRLLITYCDIKLEFLKCTFESKNKFQMYSEFSFFMKVNTVFLNDITCCITCIYIHCFDKIKIGFNLK